jgi:2',3'-cyclic-nucleotide 2'-phosphodiesterase (5'-nucleotidase family)
MKCNKRFLAIILTFIILFSNGSNILPINNIQAGQELFFTILHTNDEHSALVPSPLVDYKPGEKDPSLGGFARLAGAVKNIREEKSKVNEPVLLVSAGDFLGGSPFAWLALEGKAPELSLMVELGYDVVTIGNHEFDYGPEVLAQYLKAAGYPGANSRTALVSSNIIPPPGHPLGEAGIMGTYLKELPNGLKLGFFGLIGKDATRVAPYTDPVKFADQVETAKKSVEILKGKGADVIIAVTHLGEEEDIQLAKEVDGIDVIVGGHSHTKLTEPIFESGTIIVQAYELVKNLGVLNLAYDTASKKVRIRNNELGQPFLIPIDNSVLVDPHLGSLVDQYTAGLNQTVSRMTNGRFNDINDILITSQFIVTNLPKLQESPFGNFITDAMRIVSEQVTGEKVHLAFQANGAIRGAIVPGTMPYSKDKVNFFDLVDLVGLGTGPDKEPGYPMVSVYFTGKEIRRILEISVFLSEFMGDTYFLQVSGLRMTYDPKRAILFTVPIKNIPLPSTRSVLSAELFMEEGIQGDSDYKELSWKDDQLYHVVSDYYIASFLPMVGELLPMLKLVMKDKDGNPIENLEDAIIYRDGKELKVWQAVVEYAASQPVGPDGLPRMPVVYAHSSGRLTQERAISLRILLLMGILGISLIIVLLIRLIRGRKRRYYSYRYR